MIKSGKDVDLSSLCPQFAPDGLLLTLQVHGDRNSMMQNITYSPVDQDPFLSFSFVFLFHCPILHYNYWCLLVFFKATYFI